MELAAARAELGALAELAYLNTGTFGPLPRRTLEAMASGDRLDYDQGRTGAWYPDEILALREELRSALAAFVSAPPETVALTRSTTEGCSIVCLGLGLGPGDEVITTDVEHFGLLGPLGATGATIRVASLRALPPGAAFEAIRGLITPATRLIAISHVAWTNGQVLPVRELAGLGVPVLVDGAQSVAAIPVDVPATGAAFYAFSGQKWLLGPGATGGLVVDPAWIDRLRVASPSYYSQQSYDGAGGFMPRDGAARFDAGWLSRATIDGLLASLAYLADVGDVRCRLALDAAARCRELLEERVELVTPPGQATLVTWSSHDALAESRLLAGRGVIVRNLPSLPWVRASVGFWTSEDDLARLADAVSAARP
jgi:L-cysteine/cystine lyase